MAGTLRSSAYVEAFYKNVIYGEGISIFPYINVAVSNHPLNPSNQLKHIDRSYIVCIDGCLNRINGQPTEYCKTFEVDKLKCAGLSGFDLNKSLHIELDIYCKQVFLQTLPDSLLSVDFWVPVNIPSLIANMEGEMVDKFFSNLHLPHNLQGLLKDRH